MSEIKSNGLHKNGDVNWNLQMTTFAVNTDNPLRKIWEGKKVKPNKDKKLITLQIGESCFY